MANTIYVLSGPTASGKSALALEWAERNQAEILSCDALLFYRGMDVGTAKPSKQERSRVIHHGIDLVEVDEPFDISRYVSYAKNCVELVFERDCNILVTGGSGFYLKSFFAPVVDGLDIPEEVSEQVMELFEKEGLEDLLGRLCTLNPEGLGGLDERNPMRVVKALERCLASGRTLVELRQAFESQQGAFADYDVRLCVLDREDDALKERIKTRTQKMLEDGLVEEVMRLRGEGLLENPSAARAIGYAQTLDWLDAGGGDSEVLVAAINKATWRLVRKQRSWFRNQLPEGIEHLPVSFFEV